MTFQRIGDNFDATNVHLQSLAYRFYALEDILYFSEAI